MLPLRCNACSQHTLPSASARIRTTQKPFVQFVCYRLPLGCRRASDRVCGWVHYIAHPSAHTAAANGAPWLPRCFRPCAFSAALNRDAEPAHCRGEKCALVTSAVPSVCILRGTKPRRGACTLPRRMVRRSCEALFSKQTERVRRDRIHHKGNP